VGISDPVIVLIFVFTFIISLFAVILISIIIEERSKIKRMGKLRDVVESANGSLLLGITPEFHLDIPDLSIPDDVKLKRLDRADMEFRVTSLKGNVIQDRLYKSHIRNMMSTIEENKARIESLSLDYPVNREEIRDIVKENGDTKRSIFDMERKIDRNAEDFHEKVRLMRKAGVRIPWFHEMEGTLGGDVKYRRSIGDK